MLDNRSKIAAIVHIVLGSFSSLLSACPAISSAVAYLKRSLATHTPLIIFSIIVLFNVAVGTAVGGYSLRVLLRK
ncbi:hypothetical protein SAMN05518865_10785 [Duganella sp. CF458]|uniref:hypothetical protein n=1 Tax=Duganella sp. CF458 TaxID=1884368 RepID=UPI0008E8BA76|nr:hypothetical protein [Duganella sp. CF458]SFG00864.1 hypothetical protein SAMN05518865_10785 [Duganella sp. CF458]